MRIIFLFLIIVGCTKNNAETVRPSDSSFEFELKKSSDETQFASYDGESISTAQIKENTPTLELAGDIHNTALKLKAYQESLRRLKGIVIRRALNAAAQKEGLLAEDFIGKNLDISKVISNKDFESYLDKKGIRLQDLTPEQTAAVRANALQEQREKKIEDYAVENLIKTKIYVYEYPPTIETKLSEEWNSLWGPQDAPISIVFFGDLMCSPCKTSLLALTALEQEFRGHLKIGFNFFIPSNDRNSVMLSEAALCTYEQGPKYFRKLTAVFLTKEDWTEDDIHQAVQQSGANTDQFKSCFFKRTYEKLLNQHLAYSTSVGVTAPPTILVDGEPLEGAISRGELRELVRRRIESKSPAWRAFIRRLKYYFKN